MAISLKHSFQSAIADGGDTSLVQPSNWNAEHTLTLATGRLLGRTTAGTGAAEEISVSSDLSLSGGVLGINGALYPTGGSTDKIFWNNGTTVTTSYSIPSTTNAGTFGPVTINSGATVTIPSSSTWTVI